MLPAGTIESYHCALLFRSRVKEKYAVSNVRMVIPVAISAIEAGP